MYSFYGETVLDPFLGSGTTSLAAEETGRDSIGYELNSDFEPIIRRKLGLNGLFSGQTEVTFEQRLASLPSRPNRSADSRT